MRRSAICLAISLVSTPGLAIADCPALGAQYHLAGQAEAATLTLRPSTQHLAYSDLEIALSIPGQDAEFLFDPVQSQGYGSVFAVARDAGMQDLDLPMQVFALAANGQLVPSDPPVPQGAEAAPDAIYIAGLGSALWYATNGADTPALLEQGLWYLACH